jgi:hypothetical protein
VLPGGDLLTVSGGVLYVVDPATGVADRVEVSGLRWASPALTGGDGLELRGNTLYVVRGFGRASVVVLRLGQGRVARRPSPRRSPTPTSTSRRRLRSSRVTCSS